MKKTLTHLVVGETTGEVYSRHRSLAAAERAAKLLHTQWLLMWGRTRTVCPLTTSSSPRGASRGLSAS